MPRGTRTTSNTLLLRQNIMDIIDTTEPAALHMTPAEADAIAPASPPAPSVARDMLVRWLIQDSPYITMLVLALAGIVFRLPVVYWIVLAPVFGVISVAAGWRHFQTRKEHLTLACTQALNWGALLFAVFLLYDSGVHQVLNANANSLTMMILLALGTFVAGVQSHVWRISAVGAILFMAVPGLGWLDQSPLLWTAATLMVIALAGVAWWVTERPGAAPNPVTT